MKGVVETPTHSKTESKTNQKTQKESINTRKWIEMRSETKYWKGIIKFKGNANFSLVTQEGELIEIADAESTQKEEIFTKNDAAIKKMHELIKVNLASGFMIEKCEKQTLNSQLDSAASYRSSKGLLNNLTVDDSNSASNQELSGSLLAKRDHQESGKYDAQDNVSKHIKTTSAQKSPKKPGKNSAKNKSLDKEGLVNEAQQNEQSERVAKRKGSKRERLRLSVKAGDLINQVKKEGDLISIDNLTPAKGKKASQSKSHANSVSVKKNLLSQITRSVSKNSITPKTPQSIRSIVASTIVTPPKIDYSEIAQYNTVAVGEKVFLSEFELENVFNSQPPKIIPQSSFKGIYLERKVFSEHVPTLKEAQMDPKEIVTEYYSLQIDQNYCYLEYGVIEEPDAMQCQLHESYDFIESYCICHKIKQLRTEIGFEEKREKLVYSLNGNLIDTIKKNQDLYFKHEKRICENPDVSFQVLQSQEKANKVKQTIGTDERELAVMRELKSGSRRGNENSGGLRKGRVKTTLNGATNSEDSDKMDIEQPETQTEAIQVQIEPQPQDKVPLVNVREDIGQSDLDIIYDKCSHSNPLHDFSDIDINYEFKNSMELSAEELVQRRKNMEAFEKGELKPNQNPAR